MAVYLFTLHAYRSWNADHPRGFVIEGEGIQQPNKKLARFYDEEAACPPVRFETAHQNILIWIAYDACSCRDWRLHYVATDPTHVHILVSWRTYQPWQEVRKKLKTLSSLMLGKKFHQPGRPWFSRKGSRKWVRDSKHFDYLVTTYLPKHRGQKWQEGKLPPSEPAAIDPKAS